MVNMVMLVGRLTKDPEMVETENGTKVSRVTLAINRMFKNSDGVYQTDYVDCVLWNNFAKNVSTYCSKGDLIVVRGRLQVDKEGIKKKVTDVIAESITFLSSSKNKEGTVLESN